MALPRLSGHNNPLPSPDWCTWSFDLWIVSGGFVVQVCFLVRWCPECVRSLVYSALCFCCHCSMWLFFRCCQFLYSAPSFGVFFFFSFCSPSFFLLVLSPFFPMCLPGYPCSVLEKRYFWTRLAWGLGRSNKRCLFPFCFLAGVLFLSSL